MVRLVSLCLVVCWGLVAWGGAGLARAEVQSGPAEGSEVAALKVQVVAGNAALGEIEFSAANKEKLAVYLFVPASTWARPVARFVRELDQALLKNRPEIQLVVVWLSADAAAGKEYLPKAQQSLKLDLAAWTVFEGDLPGPNGWGINDRAHLTAVITAGPKVVASLPFVSLNETDVPSVLEKLPARK